MDKIVPKKFFVAFILDKYEIQLLGEVPSGTRPEEIEGIYIDIQTDKWKAVEYPYARGEVIIGTFDEYMKELVDLKLYLNSDSGDD